MPTVPEQLEGLVQFAIRLGTETCYLCDGSGRREDSYQVEGPCDLCDGSGRTKYTDTRCALCRGNGRVPKWHKREIDCDLCDGGVTRPERHSLLVHSHVLSGCIGMMTRAREETDFDRLNQLLDWAMGFCLEAAAVSAAMMQQDPNLKARIGDMVSRAGEYQAVDLGAKLTPCPLTAEEIEALHATLNEPD